MKGKNFKHKTITHVFIIVITAAIVTGNSIMEIINRERVEKILAERRNNVTAQIEQERRLLQNSVNGGDSYLFNNRDKARPESNHLGYDNFFVKTGFKNPKNWHRFRDCSNNIHSLEGKVHKPRSNLTGVPDVSSLLSDFTGVRVNNVLKSDDNSQLVTKKEYLKKDWCKTEPILQKIQEEGCITRTILNRFCYGQCNSFYIPKNPPKRKRNRKKHQTRNQEEWDENPVFKSCGFCKPRRSSWMLVTLKCPTLVPPYRKKKVQRIKQCKCISETIN